MKRVVRIKSSPKDRALKVLKTIIDPEIGENIVDLGLIYDLKVENERVEVLMTLTSFGCPLAGFFVKEIESRLRNAGFKDVKVEITFDPIWTPERMSKEVRKRLGI